MFEHLKSRLANWRRSKRTYNELSALSDRDLSDIGISRSDIPRISRHSAGLDGR
jgi:uncharacterized protein YjiS (DUF1127 family)